MITSIFKDYALALQFLVDAKSDKFAEAIYPKYFDMGIPQMTLNYVTAIGRTRVEAAASVVAHGAAAPLRSRPGIERLTGEVAAIKVKRPMDEQSYREYMAMQSIRTMGGSDDAKTRALKYIWDDVKFAYDSVVKRIDIMVAQALSTGVVAIDITTNPDGIIPGNIDLFVPTTHKSKTGHADYHWSKPGGLPITDIAKIVTDAEAEGIAYEKILMTPAKLRHALNTTQVVNLELRTLDQLNGYLLDSKFPIIETVSVVAPIEKDGKISIINAWDTDNVVFIPAGKQGIIHNAISVDEIAPQQGVVYAKNNNVLISKWGETEPFGEYTRGEIAAFPGLETADSIWILDTQDN